jgi:hypothetical protein
MSNEPMTNDQYWEYVHDARANALFKTQGALLVTLEYLQAGDLASAENALKTAISYGEGLPFGGLAAIPPGEIPSRNLSKDRMAATAAGSSGEWNESPGLLIDC